MSNIFSKFFMSFGFNKKNKYLPAGSEAETASTATGLNTSAVTCSIPTAGGIETVNVSNTVKPLASFDISIEKPRYQGAIPEATIKFYPVD